MFNFTWIYVELSKDKIEFFLDSVGAKLKYMNIIWGVIKWYFSISMGAVY